jgi:hypothetical protein
MRSLIPIPDQESEVEHDGQSGEESDQERHCRAVLREMIQQDAGGHPELAEDQEKLVVFHHDIPFD